MRKLAALIGVFGVVAGTTALAENNSSQPPLTMGAAVKTASPVQATDNYVLGDCRVSMRDSEVQIRPAVSGDSYLYNYHGGDSRYKEFTFNDDAAKVTLIKAPVHGEVEHEASEISNNYYHYIPSEGYLGQDRFVMQVEKNGVKVQIQYLIEVVDEPTTYIGDDGERHDHYCNPPQWKISATTPELDGAIIKGARLEYFLRG